ncbi:hypothetical protein D3C86_1825250 [compost metagenome]
MDHFDLLQLCNGQRLIEDIQHHHRKQARLKLIRLRLGLGQLDETVSQFQGSTHLTLDLIEQLGVADSLMSVDVEQGENCRVGRPQIMGQEAQQYATLLLGITLNAEVGQAQ